MAPAADHLGHDASTVQDYLRVLRRRKWIVLLATLLVPLAAICFSVRQQKLYAASAEVLISPQNLALSLNNVYDPSLYQDPKRMGQTQSELAKVPAVAERVLKATGLSGRVGVGTLLRETSVSTAQDSNLMDFTVTDPDPGRASLLATSYARQFAAYRHELDNSSLMQAREGVLERLRGLRAKGQESSPLYNDLTEKEQQLSTMIALQTGTVKPVRLADAAWQVQPNPQRNAILGLGLGILLGIGLAFLREALDTRVRTAEEIHERLGLPLLARIPSPPKRLRGERLVMMAEPGSVEAEAFRMLRTNLEFANLERCARTIMVTSAVQAEGKSTTVANLALALARAGKRVVLVDLDLRRPYIDRFFRLEDQPGVTDVALGHAGIGEAVAPMSPAIASIAITDSAARANGNGNGNGNGRGRVVGTLDVLPAGPIPPDPGEFVGTRALGEILDELSVRADVVLVDAPPLLHLGDALTLSARVDAMLVVTRMNVVRRPMLNELHRVLDGCPAEKLGFVVTGADAEEGYGDGYGYGYYSKRGYAESARERQPVA